MIHFWLVPRRRQVDCGKLGSTCCRPLPRSLSLVAHCHPVQLPAKRPCELLCSNLLSLAYPCALSYSKRCTRNPRLSRHLRRFVLDCPGLKPRRSPSGLPQRKASLSRTPSGWRLKRKRALPELLWNRGARATNPPKPSPRATRAPISSWPNLRPCRFSIRVPRATSWTILMPYDRRR